MGDIKIRRNLPMPPRAPECHENPMSAPIATPPLTAFRDELDAAERASRDSNVEWAVRESTLERRLAALNLRAADMKLRRPAPSPRPTRDAVPLYAGRWCHVARGSLLLAK